jgi:hypothetical protein
MKISGTVSESDFLKSQYLHLKPNLIFSILGILICLAALMVLVFSFSWILLACIAYFVLYFGLFIPWRARKLYREYTAMREPVTVNVSDEGLEFISENGQGILPWVDIRKTKSNKTLLLVYPNRSIFHIIPSHFFASTEEYLEFIGLFNERCK